ncbi:MAG TPA: DUF559 domain-containing protein [Pseudolysinimonas sp.]|jgi:very-short-patch-repair endonuclease|nr:DUF559 domain-containing protein [Pseudolysinimonas sp.]
MPWLTRRELERQGYSGEAITRAVATGMLLRLRRGLYCTPDADPALQRAVRAGGRLTCVSELRRLGVWVFADDLVHVAVPPNAARLPDMAGVRRHWSTPRPDRGSSPQHVSPSEAVEAALHCLPPRMAVASLDSILHLRVIGRAEFASIRSRVTARQRRMMDLADSAAESGLESIVRVLLIELGLHVRSQVRFGRDARVDLLVEDWVVVETDGDGFHDEKTTTRDRRRDAALARRGLVVLRFRYAQVIYELESVAHAIVATVETHRRIRNSGRIAARARSRLKTVDFS